ncbi:MAG TPA: helix-turn-helix transcriptional regulator [Sulfuricurvum sp.]|nr:helix-turn-helix transcriptional regulator [Sulfuricurvum sp.]HQT37274.1 helix-turn-helix transcriptional regulator [Sulfuricurvum sp.]
MKSIDEINDTDIDALYRRIGVNVKKYRELNSMTQLQLSLAMNLKSPGLISQGELYINKQHFNIKHLYQLAHILECDITDFFQEN